MSLTNYTQEMKNLFMITRRDRGEKQNEDHSDMKKGENAKMQIRRIETGDDKQEDVEY